MKFYNRELNIIQNNERQLRMQRLVREVSQFIIDEYGIDEKIIAEKVAKISFVERTSGESYFVEYNGKKEEMPDARSAASFVTHKSQKFDGKKWNFENAVYTNDTIEDHRIRHELFHYFSNVLKMEFNKNGIGYDKSGVRMTGYDNNDRQVDSSLDADGLNEGITELSAQKLDGSETIPNSYCYQVFLADILVNTQDNSLVQAYFSNDVKEFKKFLSEFGKRQSKVSVEELIKFDKDINLVDNPNNNLLLGATEYSLSFCQNLEDFNKEKNRLLKIIENISKVDFKKGKERKQLLLSCINQKEDELKKEEKTNSSKEESVTKQSENRRQFVDRLITRYDSAETDIQYKKRAEESMRDVVRFHKILNLKGKDNCLSEFNMDKNLSEKQILMMIRLLKTARTLTNSKRINISGRNYLEEFISIDGVSDILNSMRKDAKSENSFLNLLKEKADENLKSGIMPNYPLTDFEKECEKLPTSSGKDSRTQVLEQTLGKSQEQIEREEKDKSARKQMEEQQKRRKDEIDNEGNNSFLRIKRDIFNSKLNKKEMNQQRDSIAEEKRIERLQIMEKSGIILTDEQKNAVEQYNKQMTYMSNEFKTKQNNKKSHGLEM